MDNPRYNFGLIDSIKAEAIGEPGQRRFRITVSAGNVSADLWLEKTQLFRLSVVIKQEIINVGYSEQIYEAQSTDNISNMDSKEPDSFEIDVGNINLFYIQEENIFSISVYGLENDTGPEIHLSFKIHKEQLNLFADQAQEVCAAGRPLCPLCNSPMGVEPHRCARSNGHHAN
ncbi:MAG: DUF3090 family protein [SAR202 cluster bacterium]|nr:DUF3090 family protein [SAR202 cluster bacterium]|tara:strand:+ start:4290 stop:4808 length:519 start_codon:yes stop_codon:yes gene_type:complete